ncbi:MAG: U32 family peptidase [Erysipelotrichia bacterium]|nr:U32 family peptidase [Erysipelotrichia bacterium]
MPVELLAPAGDLARLKIAVQYGADAVYLGGKQFSLRARASNFSLQDINEAVEYAHKRNCKVYVTVNMIPHDSDFDGLIQYLQQLEQIGVDAIICASKAILSLCKEYAPKMEVHISTQQTTTNLKAVQYWQQSKADRLVLAREVDYANLQVITQNTSMPIEVFIHGGMCANYSGRCVISNLLTNRDANRGGCAQSCRWNYHLYHNDESLDQDDFLFSFGSKDLCAADYIEKLLQTSVASLKIEGRMKTAYYIATVVKAYRNLIDFYQNNGYISTECLDENKKLIQRCSNRESFNGFYPGLPDRNGQIYNNIVTANQSYVANVLNYSNGLATIEVRNYFKTGDKLRLFNPKGQDIYFNVGTMKDINGEIVEIANKPMQKLSIEVPVEVNEFTFITIGEE